MNTARLNITLPSDIAKAIKGIENKSAFIAEAIEHRLKIEKKRKLISALREGYAATKTEDKKISKEWRSTEGDDID